jgi:hypothetical protein
MAINAPYYLNAANLTSATSVYLDSALNNLAPDGFYRDGTVVREQSSGILLAVDTCPSCTTACGAYISGGAGGDGIYLANLDTGTSTGAIVIRFDPENIPDGIRVTYDGTVFNKLSSPVNGLHQSSNSGHFTLVGNSAAIAGCSSSWYPSGGTLVLDEYSYNGTAFVSTGNTQSITISPGDISLGVSPGSCVMVIPKPIASPNIVNIETIGPCGITGWNLTAPCPAALPSFPSSVVNLTSSILCSESMPNTYYFAKVHTAIDTYVGLYDYAFSDVNGQYPLPNGYYLTSNAGTTNKVLQIANGIVVAITNCI